VITHYGLFWSSDDVYWSGVKGNQGHLRGKEKTRLERRGRPKISEINNATSFSEYAGIYCLYKDTNLIYIGEAGLANNSNLFERLKSHRSDYLADRWDKFSWFGRNMSTLSDHDKIERKPLRESLAQLEAILIAVTNPGFNKQSGTFSNAIQVFQVPHEYSEGDIDTRIGRMTDKMDEIIKKLDAIEKNIGPVVTTVKKPRGRPRLNSTRLVKGGVVNKTLLPRK
jgi:hypothetical protein